MLVIGYNRLIGIIDCLNILAVGHLRQIKII